MTAKDTFISSEHRLKWEEVSQSPYFQAACDYALLTMVEQQDGDGLNPSQSWDAHSQLVGARRLVAILKNLHVKRREPEPLKWDQLKP